jgi:hypothetical protein
MIPHLTEDACRDISISKILYALDIICNVNFKFNNIKRIMSIKPLIPG